MSAAPGPIRVLVVDDQAVVREGLTVLVGLIDGVAVVGAAGDGAEALELASQLHPEVALMDLIMPRMGGVEATRNLARLEPSCAVLVLTTYADDESVVPALRAGARGYLTKDASVEELARAIRAVRDGETHLSPVAQERLVARVTAPTVPASTPGMPAQLTAREIDVLQLIAQGLSNEEIAECLVLSRATVKTHVNRIFSKTDSRDRAQAVRFAFRTGLVAGEGGDRL